MLGLGWRGPSGLSGRGLGRRSRPGVSRPPAIVLVRPQLGENIGKAARAMGMANIDSAARVCHAPSTLGLKATVGVAATTCSYQDVIDSDLIVIWGANPANNQPVFMKYLYLARRRGCRPRAFDALNTDIGRSRRAQTGL